MSDPRTVIVGAGIIGLACAQALRRRGHRVVLIDRGEPGQGCSARNAGWIVPSFSMPLPSPGLTWRSLRWMFDRDSPLHMKPSTALRSSGWLWRFLRHCNAHDFDRGLAALARLNRTTMQCFDALAADGVEFEQHRRGVLFAFLTETELQATYSSLSKLGAHGYLPPQLLRGAELHAQEPALRKEVQRGILVSGERHVRPETLIRGLVDWLRRAEVDVRSGVAVRDWIRRDGRIVGVRTSAGDIPGDHFILAAGARSAELAKPLGLSLPVLAGKGYSITFDHHAVALRQPLDLGEARMVCTPFSQGWRIAGTMEFSGLDERVDSRRVATLRRGAARYLNLPPTSLEPGIEWAGLRPLTPDGLPLIGRLPDHLNTYVATGHAMQGLTLAPVTASLVSDLITAGHSDIESSPFDPGRFSA